MKAIETQVYPSTVHLRVVLEFLFPSVLIVAFTLVKGCICCVGTGGPSGLKHSKNVTWVCCKLQTLLFPLGFHGIFGMMDFDWSVWAECHFRRYHIYLPSSWNFFCTFNCTYSVPWAVKLMLWSTSEMLLSGNKIFVEKSCSYKICWPKLSEV